MEGILSSDCYSHEIDNTFFFGEYLLKNKILEGTTSLGTSQKPAETGFYYLRSRYYDPAVGRFLNADVYASTGQGFDGNNMFAYCGNNPVVFSDQTGRMLERTAGGGYGGGGGFVYFPGFSPGGGESFSLWKWIEALLWGLLGIKAASDNVSVASDVEALRLEKFDIKAKEREAVKDKTITITVDPPDEQYSYWTAEIVGGIVTPIKPLTYSEARDWAALERNLLCINQEAALAIVRFYPHYICDGPHRKGDCRYLPHYHLNNGMDPETGHHRSHIWYLG